jgi:type I restriction enzyme S subunit
MKSGWVTKKLGEVCEIKLGKTPPRDDYSFWDRQKSSGYVWVSISDMASLTDGQIIDSKEYITNKAIEEAGVPIVKKGTLLLSFKLTIGRTAIAGRDLSTNEAIAALPLKQEFAQLIDLHYLVFYFAAFDWYLFAAKDDKMLGKTLNKKRLATVPVLIPPLAEQKRIVAKIDAAFEKIDKLKANAEKNLANAKELFQSALDEAMRPKDGCNFVSLTSVSEKIFAGGDKPEIIVKESTENIKIPIYSNGENNDGLYGYTQYATVVKPAVTVSARGTIGFCSIRRVPYVPIVRLISVIPNDKVLLEYLYYSLKSLKIKNTGSSIPQLTVPMIKEFNLPIRPLSEQREIVKRLDLLSEKIKMLEQNYIQQIADCVEMRQAVLREAFEGRL